jgi:hypothetical integral membrane protein (TIGR02206 family)
MRLFGAAHVTILATIAGLAVALVRISRRNLTAARLTRLSLGWFLIVNEVVWYAFRYSNEGLRFPDGLPLQLCDVMVWVTAIAALRRSSRLAEFAYFAGLGGSLMALLTPDLWAPLLSYPTIYFFLAHGAVVTANIVLVFGRQTPLKSGCVRRAFILLNVYTAAVGTFDFVFRTNYFYLCQKPQTASPLDWFGPWPYYIVVAEFFALAMFALMWLAARKLRSAAGTAI